MNLVKQPTPYSCAAACVAMITGMQLEIIFSDLGHDGSEKYFRFTEYAAVLNRYGFHLGMYSASSEAGRKRLVVMSATSRTPALVIVAGGENNHAVFWTGRKVMDPLGRDWPLENYLVLEWWPIIQFKG